MSTNDVLTLVVAGAGAMIAGVTFANTVIAGRRAARQSFADRSREVLKLSQDYTAAPEGDKYARSLDLEVVTREAGYLLEQCGKTYPEGGAIAFAQAMDLVGNNWWADRWWEQASRTGDPYYRCRTMAAWAYGLWSRGQQDRAKQTLKQAVENLTLKTPDAAIVRGDAYREMAGVDMDHRTHWYELARREYETIPADDLRRGYYLSWASDGSAGPDPATG